MDWSHTARGQSGLDRLLFFVLAVVAILLVAPHVLGALGVDVGPSAAPPPGETADHDLVVLEARGTAIDTADGSIGAVRLVVTPAPGRAPVDLGDQLAIWVGDRSYYLSPDGSGEGVDGAYLTRVVDGEGRLLGSASARGELVFDLGTDDVEGVGEFGRRLEAGETVSVTLVTPRGETVTRQLVVPERLEGDSVGL